MTRQNLPAQTVADAHHAACGIGWTVLGLLVLASATALQTAHAAEASRFGDVPTKTEADAYRVREGHVAAIEERDRDAETAAAGQVIGATPALDAALSPSLSVPPVPDELRDQGQTRSRDASSLDANPRDANPRDAGSKHAGTHDDGSSIDNWYGDTWIADLGTLLRGDRDGDGFFGAVEFTIDADSDAVSRDVYAVIELIDTDNVLTLRHETATFTLYGRATSDAYRIEIELLRNHAAGWRDGRVELRDSFDGRLLDEATAYTHLTLSALPLESEVDEFPADDDRHDTDHDRHHPSGYAGGVILTGSSHGEAHAHGEDHYVAGYAAASTPLSLLALSGLAFGRLAFVRLAFVRLAFGRLAFVRLAFVRLAFGRLAIRRRRVRR